MSARQVFLAGMLLIAALLPLPGNAQELIVNGSFETGDLTGWTTANVGDAIFEVRTGGQAGTWSGNAENPLAGGGTFVAYGNTDAGSRAVLYQDVTIPANAASALLSFDLGFQDTGGGLTDLALVDVVDLAGNPLLEVYTGGTIYTQYYFRNQAIGGNDDPMAARAAVNLIAAGISPGSTVRIRAFMHQSDFDVRFTIDRVSLVTTETTPPTPAGGPTDMLGLCDPEIYEPLPLNGQETQAVLDGSDLTLIRLLPAPELSGEEFPGLIIRLTDPQGNEVDYFSGLGGQTGLTAGLDLTTALINCQSVRSISLSLVLSGEFLATLAPGRYTITYYLIDSSGNRSNLRWEYIDIPGTASEAVPGRIGSAQDPTSLSFGLSVNQLSLDDYLFHPADDGLCRVTVGGAVYGDFAIANGRVEPVIPFGQTSIMTLFWPGAAETVTLRMEFENGFLMVYDENRNDAPVDIYLPLGSQAYALEFYRNRIYICASGDPGGAVLGRLYEPR